MAGVAETARAVTELAAPSGVNEARGDFDDFFDALVADKINFDAAGFEPSLEISTGATTGLVDVTFNAFGGRMRYASTMTNGQWMAWQAKAKREANFSATD